MAKFIEVTTLSGDKRMINFDNVSYITRDSDGCGIYGNFTSRGNDGGLVPDCIAYIKETDYEWLKLLLERNTETDRMCRVLREILDVIKFRLH